VGYGREARADPGLQSVGRHDGGAGAGDLPWDQVRKALDDVGFTGWATAEVGGGDVKRLTQVRQQMQKAFGL